MNSCNYRDQCSLLNPSKINPSKFKSCKAQRGPFWDQQENWMQTSQHIMTCYKSVNIQCKIFGLQSKLENLILNQYRQMLLGFHQQLWCWTDQWFDLSLIDVQDLERKSKLELEQNISDKIKRNNPIINN